MKGFPTNITIKNSVFFITSIKTHWKNIVLTLVSRTNQDEISIPNIASVLAEAIVTDRNPKEHSQNKNNQKGLPL